MTALAWAQGSQTASHSSAFSGHSDWLRDRHEISECQQDPVRLLEEENVPYFAGNARNKEVSLELLGAPIWNLGINITQ